MEIVATKNSKFLKTFIATVSIIILSYVTYGFYRIYVEEVHGVQPPKLAAFTDVERLRLLAETSAAIVQGYYVDPARVDADALLELMMKKLLEIQVVSVAHTATGHWQLHDGGRTLTVPPVTDMPHLSQTLLEIAAWLSKTALFTQRYDLQEADEGVYYLLNELLTGLDSHSALLTSDEYSELKQGTEGEFGGIGILVGIRDDLLTVIKPLPNSPAARAGLQKRDRIITIDGRHTFEFSLDQLVKHMRGDPDTRVNLSLLRSGDMSPRQVQIRREIVQVDSINTRRVRAGDFPVLYVQIENFATRTATEIETALNKFRRHVPHRYGVVLDLRGNPGGLLDQAVQVADLFISHGRILSTTGRRAEVEQASYTSGETDYPLIVLIDRDSASASEIVAGALQDHERAFIVGQPSFGKGSVQTIFELPYGQALKLTIARYFTPNGRSIQDTGIYPHIWLQPVTQQDNNSNLLGAHRYRNDTHSDAQAQNFIRSLYLLNSAKVDDYEELQTEDTELDLALAWLTQILRKNRYGSAFSTARHRQLPPQVQKILQRDTTAVEQWLQQQHQIDWRSATTTQDEHRVRLKLAHHQAATVAGEMLTVAYSLRNLLPTPLARVSLFVRADFQNFNSEEYLLGKIISQKHAKLNFKIPVATHPGVYQLEIGAALDGIVQQHSVQRFHAKILPPQPPVLDMVISLEDEQPNGKLEAGEYGDVVVAISNHSSIAARDLTIKLLNLAGRQLHLLKAQQQLPLLAPGQQKKVRFPLRATHQLFSASLPLGVSLNSANLSHAVKKQYTLEGAM